MTEATSVDAPFAHRKRPLLVQVLFFSAVGGALAFLNCFYKYETFVGWTLDRNGNFWPDGRPVGVDFLQYAAVAEAWERGRIDELYASPGRQQEFMTLALESPTPVNAWLPFNYPPFVAWLLYPLAPFDYLQRFAGWTLILSLFAITALVCWKCELGPWTFGVVAIGFALSPPVASTVLIGQASFIGLASVSGTLLLLNRGRDFAAGLVLALLFYKPSLGVVLGPLLLVACRWRLVGGVALGALLLGLASLAVSPNACNDYPKILRELSIVATSTDFFTRHFNLLGFVAVLSDRPVEDFNWVRRALVVVPAAVLLVSTAKAWCTTWRPGSPSWQAGASAAVLATLVATPYLFAYDTVLVAVAAVYSIKTWDARPEWHRWFILCCLVVVGWFVAGDVVLLDAMRRRGYAPLQLAPIAMAAWAVLEIRWSIAAGRREVADDEPSGDGNRSRTNA